LNFFFFFFQDLKETLKQELDFEHEGRNGERCAKELAQFGFVHVPKIYWDMTSKVLAVNYLCMGILICDVFPC
jgi:aarF domain-containing kinase